MRPLGVNNHGTDGVVVIVKPDLVALIPDDGSYLCREHGNAWNGERFGLLLIRALEKAFTEPNVGKTVRQIEFEKGTGW